MKIEGNYLIFSTGKKLESRFGVVALDNDSDMGLLDYRELITPILTDQEQWELARYMIGRWMDVRDKLWARHEDAMKREEPVEKFISEKDKRDRLEARPTFKDMEIGATSPTLKTIIEEALVAKGKEKENDRT